MKCQRQWQMVKTMFHFHYFWMWRNTKTIVVCGCVKLMWIEVRCQQNWKSISHLPSLKDHLCKMCLSARSLNVAGSLFLFPVCRLMPSRENSYLVSPFGNYKGCEHFGNDENIFCQIKLWKENLCISYGGSPRGAWRLI